MTEPLALYVHWPFCQSKCPYCDFNSHVANTIDHARWRDALTAELEHYRALTGPRAVSSVFFGGGTPSLMEGATVATLIEAAERLWGFSAEAEITLEANPSSAEARRFRDYRAAGDNRLSLGVQSFEPEALAFLGRHHDVAEAERALALAGEIFPRHSFDLIYARPGQALAQWQAELTHALGFVGEHLSVYQLTIEPGTAFFRERVAAAEEDLGADMFAATRDLLAAAGLPAYEVSNHARPGCASRHNLTYWRGGDYVGVGPGAHGRLTRDGEFQATHQIADPARWLEQVGAKGEGTAKLRRLDAHERAEEMVMTGLRMAEGLDTERLERITGLALDRLADPAALQRCVAGRLLVWKGTRLLATAEGMLRLNAMLAHLLAPAEDDI
ncbi:MAG: radical SAM family heme chaperone HemW [Rhodospirillaceae bacterium]